MIECPWCGEPLIRYTNISMKYDKIYPPSFLSFFLFPYLSPHCPSIHSPNPTPSCLLGWTGFDYFPRLLFYRLLGICRMYKLLDLLSIFVHALRLFSYPTPSPSRYWCIYICRELAISCLVQSYHPSAASTNPSSLFSRWYWEILITMQWKREEIGYWRL